MIWLNEKWVGHYKTPTWHHWSSREGHLIDSIYLHYTVGGPYTSTVRWFQEYSESRACSHFVVGRNGQVAQSAPLNVRAWHAGRAEFWLRKEPGNVDSDWSLQKQPDRSSIGIEVANFGLLDKEGGEFYLERGRYLKRYKQDLYPKPVIAALRLPSGVVDGWWEPYSDSAVEATALLCATLVKQFGIPMHRIVGHQDVARNIGRKTDPGPLWPWRRFYQLVATRLGETVPHNVTRYHLVSETAKAIHG